MLADLSRQAWFKRIPFSLGAAHSIDQPKGWNSVICETTSDDADGTQADRLQTSYHWWWVVILHVLSPWLGLSVISWWLSSSNQTKKWYRKVFNFDPLVSQLNP
jgi:hypothetical protein